MNYLDIMAPTNEQLWTRDEDFKNNKTIAGAHPPSDGTLGNTRGATMTSGFHHIALVCKNMPETIRWYESAMGMKLRAIYPMHGIKGAKHCFLEAGNGNEISFVEFNEDIKLPNINPASFFTVWPVGSHHHMAYRCETLEQLNKLRDQIKKTGTAVSKVVDHDFIKSCYFTDPNGFNLEITYTYRGYTKDEYQPDILARPIAEGENDHAESDKHGSNVVKASAVDTLPKSKL
jgi:catechol 2,3-dioxygenase-like lactoylglutathione lyase family enzyme